MLILIFSLIFKLKNVGISKKKKIVWHCGQLENLKDFTDHHLETTGLDQSFA